MATPGDLAALDHADALGHFRSRFTIPDGLIYLDGNSLGAMSDAALAAAEASLGEWSTQLIGGWNDAGWWDLPLTLGDRLGGILGAAPGQTIVCDTTTVNLYKVLHAAIRSSPGDIVAERSSFPTDLYVARGVADERGMQLRLSEPGRSPAGIADAATGVVLVNHVDFKTGALADLEAVAAEAAGCGALLVADLSHSAGVVPTSLDAWAVDFAVGCTYKYLSGGPGAPAFLYAAAEHIDAVSPVIPGWMGHAEPFLMEPEYRPRTGVRRFMTGTPSILSMRALEGALGLIEEAGMGAIREKSVALTGTLMELIEEELPEASVITPHDPAQRGGQVSIRHPAGRTLSQALTAAGVRGDFRAPDVLRFGLSPLYTSFGDLGRAVATMKSVLEGMQPGPAGGGWDVPT